MKKSILLLIAVLAAILLPAQKSLTRRADRNYANMSWQRSASFYERLIKRGNVNANTFERLGNCYRNLGDWKQAEIYYRQLFVLDSTKSKSVLLYAMALSANGNYAKSNFYYQKFATLSPSDSRGLAYKSENDIIGKIAKQDPFFSIRNLPQNTVYSEFGPTYLNGMLVFTSSRDPYVSVRNIHTWNNQPFLDLFISKISSTGDLQQIKRFDSKINKRYHEGPACFSSNGNVIYFTRNSMHNGKVHADSAGKSLLMLHRAQKSNDGWKEELLPFNNVNYSCGHPSISADGRWLYFASDMPGGFGGSDIYKARISEDGSLGAPVNLGHVINSEGNEFFPFIDSKGNLFFSSDGWPGLGGLDMFVSNPSVKDNFLKPFNLGLPINSRWDDFSMIVDSSGQNGFFCSNRQGGVGSDDIYSVKLIRELRFTYSVEGIVYNKTTMKPVENATITLKSDDGLSIGNVTTNSLGRYAFDIQQASVYLLNADCDKYFPAKSSFVSGGKTLDSIVISRNLYLDPDVGMSLLISVSDRKSGSKLPGVAITILNNLTGTEEPSSVTDSDGNYRIPLPMKQKGDRISFNISFQSEGYVKKSVTYNSAIGNERTLVLNEVLDKMEVGMDIGKIIDLKPIYFDLGKSTIRPDAAKELDKIVKVMQDNPKMVIELRSHTDCRSSATSNMTLSDKRAKSSAQYIISKGIAENRINGRGYGETQLINGCACEGPVKSTCTEQEHQMNRRTEFIVISF